MEIKINYYLIIITLILNDVFKIKNPKKKKLNKKICFIIE